MMRRFPLRDTLVARIALLLAAGTILAVAAALLVAAIAHRSEYRRAQGERALASAVDVIRRLDREPERTLQALSSDRIIGANLIRTPVRLPLIDAALSRALAERIGPASAATVSHAEAALCGLNDPFWQRSRAAGFGHPTLPDCWLLQARSAGRILLIGLDLPSVPAPPYLIADPLFLLPMALGCIALSFITARLAGRPLERLVTASRAFSRSIDAEPVAERGPEDVREALATFNLMQRRVREGLRERTRLLAAISHDLQTPLTRLRLRLEHVPDEALRERLVSDLSATLRMMRRGLDLARSGESAEDWTVVDLGSVLSSMADDAAEFGHRVQMVGDCDARVRVKPDALSRCLGNLIDNAVTYGGAAELACRQEGREVLVTVRDRGPGMAPDLLARAFEPFLRGDTAAAAGEGSGIGLAIARAQAAAIGGTLSLRNHPEGGVEAILALPGLSHAR